MCYTNNEDPDFWDQYGLYIIIGAVGAAVAAIAGVAVSKKKKVVTPVKPHLVKKPKEIPKGKKVLIGKGESPAEAYRPLTPDRKTLFSLKFSC